MVGLRPLDYILLGVALVSFAFAALVYRELYRWARQCQRARIAIAYKRKVQLQAPLVEWLGWCNLLESDERSSGRVVWRQGHATVAILKPLKSPGPVMRTIMRVRRRRSKTAPRSGAVELVR